MVGRKRHPLSVERIFQGGDTHEDAVDVGGVY